jgi:hypothetical protein
VATGWTHDRLAATFTRTGPVPVGEYALAQGQAIYADADAGDDANDGTSRAAPVATLGQALSLAPAGGTVQVAPGVYDESVTVSQDVTLLLSGERLTTGKADANAPVVVTGDFVADGAALTFDPASTAPLAVYGEVAAPGPGGAITGAPTLRLGPVIEGTPGFGVVNTGGGPDAGWRNLALAADAPAGDILDDLNLRGVADPVLYRFDALVTGSDGQGAFVPVTDPSEVLTAGTHGVWLYLFDDAENPVQPSTPIVIDTEAPFDASAAPGATFGAATTDVTLASSGFDCLTDVEPGAPTYFYLGNPFAQSFALSGLDLPGENLQDGAQVWDPSVGTTGSYVVLDGTEALAKGQAAYVECQATGAAPFDGTLTFDAAAGLTTGAPLVGKSARARVANAARARAAKSAGATTSGGATKSGGTTQATTLGLSVEAIPAAGDTLRDVAARLRFAPGGTAGFDAYDLTKLALLPDAQGRSVALAVVGPGPGGQPMRKALEALPELTGASGAVTVEVDLRATGLAPGTPARLALPVATGLPSGWTVQLLDTVTGAVTDLTPGGSGYAFQTMAADASSAQATGKRGGVTSGGLGLPPAPTPLDRTVAGASGKDGATSPRFQVRVSPQGTIPVELTGLTATATDEQAVTLTWQTATETNNAGFAVEQRIRDDGQEGSGPDAGRWREVAFVDGAGTTDEPQTYRHTVANVPYGRHAFRLRQVDFDGTSAPSEEVEVTVQLAEAYALAAYPNPVAAGQRATIDVTAREAQRVEVALYDVLGRRVAVLFDGEVAASATERVALSAQGLASGVYVVRVVGERFRGTRRVTVVR